MAWDGRTALFGGLPSIVPPPTGNDKNRKSTDCSVLFHWSVSEWRSRLSSPDVHRGVIDVEPRRRSVALNAGERDVDRFTAELRYVECPLRVRRVRIEIGVRRQRGQDVAASIEDLNGQRVA